MAGNFPNSAQDLVYTGNNHSNEQKYDQNTPSLYVDPNWRLSNNAQFVQSFLNRYSPDPNSDQTLSIPLNFQNATDLNQIHIEGNARLHEEHLNGLQRSSSVTVQRITQVLENLISGYSLFEGDLLKISSALLLVLIIVLRNNKSSLPSLTWIKPNSIKNWQIYRL